MPNLKNIMILSRTRIIRAFEARGYFVDREMAKALWEEYSASQGSDWLTLPDSDKTLFDVLQPYWKEV